MDREQTPRNSASGRRETVRDLLIGLSLSAAALIVYNATLTPSLSYKSPDGNELATVPYLLGLVHSTGYPLYTWLGKLFTYLPVGDIAHRMNLMSAVLGAAGVGLVYLIALNLTRHRLASLFTALLFAFSRTFWSQTGIAEVYAPNVFMVALTLLLLLKWADAEENGSRRATWYLLAFCLSFGLSLGTHMSNLGFAPAFAIFILLINWRVLVQPLKLFGGAGLFALGVAQFLWLPYKAHTLNDQAMLRSAPATWQGIYNYTLGAFPQFKFAFPLEAIPERIVLYLWLLKLNVGLAGILLGLYGMWELLFRRPKRFFLLILMYLVHVFFFVQYRVFDLDVFFIPAHLLYMLFIGVGLASLIGYVTNLLRRLHGERIRKGLVGLAHILLICVLLLMTARLLRANWGANDYSSDTAINDFYDNVFELLPADSVLLGRGGVFGYDMFYYRLVYDARPDVLMPHVDDPSPERQDIAGREIFTTMRLDNPQTQRGPWGLPPDLVGGDVWHIPVLLGQSQDGFTPGSQPSLMVYRVSSDAPEMIVQDAEPAYRVGARLDGVELVGYDLPDGSSPEAGGRLHLVLYWRQIGGALPHVATILNGSLLESHQPGMGNLERYVGQFGASDDGVIVEDYWVVIPSTVTAEESLLQVGLMRFTLETRGMSLSSVVDLAVLRLELTDE